VKTSLVPAIDRDYFEDLSKRAIGALGPNEHLFLVLEAECSQFVRFNQGVRQTGVIDDASLEVTLVLESSPGVLKRASREISLSGISYQDREAIREAVGVLRAEVPALPQDPFAELPKNPGSSMTTKTGNLLATESVPAKILDAVGNSVDLAGIYAAGPVIRGMANSARLVHWFSSEFFSFDYSLYTPAQRAVKGVYGGSEWNDDEFRRSISSALQKLKLLERQPRKIGRGSYRTFLEPAAVGALIEMFSWGAIGESSIRQGESPLRRLRGGEKKLSPRFSLAEDFSRGQTPRFNQLGELAPERLILIDKGELAHSLVSSRSSKEYGVSGNAAEMNEALRAPSVAPGTLEQGECLGRLGTGLHVSNLHYLNWSDQSGGRITGMTRYACFWIENGKIVAPIENMRFDDSIFQLFGSNLEELTRACEFLPESGTYDKRSVGGVRVPGMLVSGMQFTL